MRNLLLSSNPLRMQIAIEYSLPLLVAVTLLLTTSLTEASRSSRYSSLSFVPRPSHSENGGTEMQLSCNGQSFCSLGRSIKGNAPGFDVILSLRAGEVEGEEDSDDSHDDESEEVDDSEEDEGENEYDDYDEYDEEDVEVDVTLIEEDDRSTLAKEVQYDEPLLPPASMQIGTTIAVMMLCRGHDLYNPKIVRLARFAFVAYMIVYQTFLAYVRIKARMINDRTPLTLSNPLSSLVQSQLQQKGGNTGGDMVKDIASQFLSSKSTVYEYDLKQVQTMNSSLLFNMVFMWVLHFKMKQVQPLFIQTATGILSLIYSPLFQVYVLGRNLERPFKNPRMRSLQQRAEADIVSDAVAEEEDEASTAEDETAEPVVEDDENEYDAEKEDASDEEEEIQEEANNESEEEDESDK